MEERGLLAYTPATIVSMDVLTVELDAIRERGYAVDEGEHESALRRGAYLRFSQPGSWRFERDDGGGRMGSRTSGGND